MSNNRDRMTAVNSLYSDGDHYESVELRPRSRSSGQRLSTRMAMDGAPRHDTKLGPEYDKSMAELLRQLPSRQIDGAVEAVARTLRARGISRRGTFKIRPNADIEDEIVQSLKPEDSSDLETDDIDATVRTIPTALTRKRNIIHRLSSRRQKPVTKWKLLKYHCAMTWQHFKHEMRKTTRLFDLWRSHLMTIEGQFGTSVLSYFIFLKWVLLINIPIFLLTFFFLVIPQILFRYYQMEPSGYAGNTATFDGLELLTGEGFFEQTEMYYGFYTNETVEIFSGSKYMMKYAYLFTCGGYYVMCLFILGYSYLHSYRKYYIEASGNMSLYYFSLVLSGWDFGIRSQEASDLKQMSIFNEFKEYLSGVKIRRKNTWSRDDQAKKWMFRVLAWLVVLVLLGASGYATYVVSTELSIKPKLDNASSIPVVSTMAMPVAISSIQLFVPMIFTFLETYEDFDRPKYELYIHMFREMALKVTMLGVLVYFWFEEAASKIKCWETFVGEEIYRLVIVDLIFTLGYSFCVEFLRRLLSKKWEFIDRSEFAIGRHTLELVYSQALCWLGVFYSPLLPVVVIIKLIIIFYVKRLSVVHNCKPSMKPWRASRTHTIFVGYLFLFFILVFIAVGCSVILIRPSKECGPYKQYDYVYDLVHNLIDEWKDKHSILSDIFGFINSPGFAAGVLIFLCMALYYTRTIMLSHKQMVRQFKLQLASEGKDKRFLMNLLNQVKLRGRRISKHQGPNLAKTVADMSSTNDLSGDSPADHSGRVFVRTVAESLMSTPSK